MEDPVYLRLLNRIQILEDDIQLEVDRKLHLESRRAVIEHEMNYYKNKCSTVLPDLKCSKDAMESLPRSSLIELKAFKAPPLGVKAVVECLMILLDGVQDTEYDYWSSARKLFCNPNLFFKSVAAFDPTTVKLAQIKVIQSRLRGITVSKTRSVSCAASCLHQWIMYVVDYWKAFRTIKPFVDKVHELEQEDMNTSEELADVLRNIDYLDINLNEQLARKRRFLAPPPVYLDRWAFPRTASLYDYEYMY